MPVSERARHHAYTRLTETVGAAAADVIMELLPTHPTAELVTRTDFQAGIIRLQGEMAELRGEMATQRADLQSDMAELRSELRSEMAELRSELRSEMAELGTGLRGEMARLYRWGAGIAATNVAALITALVT